MQMHQRLGGDVAALLRECCAMAVNVDHLASDLASYVTGAAFVADGGLTAKTGIPTRFTE